MKLKQVFFTIVISALTAFGVMYGYSSYVKASNTFAGQEKGVIPSNYKLTGLTDGTNTPFRHHPMQAFQNMRMFYPAFQPVP